MEDPSQSIPVKAEDGLFVSDVEDQDDLDDLDEMDEGALPQHNVYDENSEPLPNAAAYDKDLAQVPVDVVQLLKGVQEAISEERRDHPRYKHMFNESARLQEIPASKKTRINIVGKSGSGKSSLLNCMLGRPDAAKALAAGTGCTHVPTKYEAPFPKQVLPCAAEIVFFSEPEIRKKLKLMLENYRTWHFDEHDWPKEEDQKYEDAAETAFDAFRSMFCGNNEFATAEDGEQFLAGARDDREVVINQLVAWCEELLPGCQDQDEHKHYAKVSDRGEKKSDEKGTNDETDKIALAQAQAPRTMSFEAETQEEIRDLVESYAFPSSACKQPSLWPLVKNVRMGLKNIRILDYVILVDWPGADDTNQLRANASAERIFECDELWIVSSAARICSEPTVTGMLARYGGIIPCSIICTQIDANRDDELAAEMRRRGYDTQHHDGLFTLEKALQKQIESADIKLDNFKAIERKGFTRVTAGGKRQKLQPDQVRREIARLESELRSCTERLNTVEQDRLEAIIGIRQKCIDFELSAKLKKHNKQGATLNLFFVSNEHYMAHKGAKKVYGPLLSLAATGIPGLRKHLLSTAAPRELNTIHEYIDHKVAVLLEGISIVVDPGDLQRCENALKMVHRKKDTLVNWKNAYLNGLRRHAEEQFVKLIEERLQDFQNAALKVLKGKSRWSYSSIRAFVKQNGRHQTSLIDWESWNEQFLEDVAACILDRWDAFADAEVEIFKFLQRKLTEEVRDLASQMRTSSAQYRLPQDQFTDFIESQLRGVHHLCEASKLELKKKFGFAKIGATQDDAESPTGYFSLAMQEIWDQCKEYTGTGSKAKVLTAFETHLKLKGDRSPFAVNAKSLVKAIIENAEEQSHAVTEGVKRILDDIAVWLDLIFKEETNTPEDVQARDRLKSYLDYAGPRFDDIRCTLKMIERRHEIKLEEEVKQE